MNDRPTSKHDTGDEGLREKLAHIFSDLGEGYTKNGAYIYRDMETCVSEAVALFASHQLALLDRVRREMPEKPTLQQLPGSSMISVQKNAYVIEGFGLAIDQLTALLDTISNELKGSHD